MFQKIETFFRGPNRRAALRLSPDQFRMAQPMLKPLSFLPRKRLRPLSNLRGVST